MSNDIITVYDNNNNGKDYKLLLAFNKEYKYIIYTDLYNNDVNNNIYAIKTKSLNQSEDTLPIDENEWKMIEEVYQKYIK